MTTSDLLKTATEAVLANGRLIRQVYMMPLNEQQKYLPQIEANRLAAEVLLNDCRAVVGKVYDWTEDVHNNINA